MTRAVLPLFGLLLGCSHRQLPELLRLAAPDPACTAAPESPALQATLAALDLPEKHTGVMMLERGAGALVARAWLARNATRSIDVQTFIFAADNVGLIAVDALLLAAERGVQVRLLVDDTLPHGDEEVLLALSMHPNAEVRIYNSNINVGKSRSEQLENALGDFQGINQRMHNKLLVVDGQAVITGGRNIAEEYFDFDEDYNFRDRDVLLLGGGVIAAQESFDVYWTHGLSQPIEIVIKKSLAVPAERAWAGLHSYSCDPANFLPNFRERVYRFPAELERARVEGDFHVVEKVAYISDAPGKNEGGWTGGGIATDALVDLVRGADKSVTIQTPYLVTTELGLGLFAEAEARGVEVRILTNSLAVTDNLAAFAGYRAGRESLLRVGVDLYELKPRARLRADVMRGPSRIKRRSTLALHAKSMVVDGQIAVVGSFNLDPRSANLNTESVAILHSAPVALQLQERMEIEMAPENAWHTTLEFNPDREASLGSRIKVRLARVVPRLLL